MIEWLFGAAKVYLIGFGVFFVLVTALVIFIFVNVLIGMRKADKAMDRWHNRHFGRRHDAS